MIVGLMAKAQNPNPDSQIDSDIQAEMQTFNLPGVSTAIVKGGKIVWMKSYGYANTLTQKPYADTTSQMLASVSKVFAGVTLMQLHEDGAFNLGDSINKFLPFPIRVPNYESTPITFKMLLTHTASIQDSQAGDDYYNWNGDPTISLADVCQRFFSTSGQDYSATENFVNSAPGSTFKYTNMGTALEGYLVELIAQKPFHTYCNENIFNLLCMNRTRWNFSEFSDTTTVANPHDNAGAVYTPKAHYGFADFPSGGLKSNVTDLANFMVTLLNGGSLNGSSILNSATIDSMLKSAVPSVDATMGLQFYTSTFTINGAQKSLWGHGGEEAGIQTEMYFDKSSDMGVVALANSRNSVKNIFEILFEYGLTLSSASGRDLTCGAVTSVDETDETVGKTFPNPTHNFVQIQNFTEDIWQLHDITGKIISSGTTATVDLSNVKSGLYFLQINGEKHAVIKN